REQDDALDPGRLELLRVVLTPLARTVRVRGREQPGLRQAIGALSTLDNGTSGLALEFVKVVDDPSDTVEVVDMLIQIVRRGAPHDDLLGPVCVSRANLLVQQRAALVAEVIDNFCFATAAHRLLLEPDVLFGEPRCRENGIFLAAGKTLEE